jgi:hypothetical protein
MSVVLAAPALPLHKAGPYVAAAYIVVLALILIYVAIMAVRLGHSERDLARLKQEMEAREREDPERETESVL